MSCRLSSIHSALVPSSKGVRVCLAPNARAHSSAFKRAFGTARLSLDVAASTASVRPLTASTLTQIQDNATGHFRMMDQTCIFTEKTTIGFRIRFDLWDNLDFRDIFWVHDNLDLGTVLPQIQDNSTRYFRMTDQACIFSEKITRVFQLECSKSLLCENKAFAENTTYIK